MEFVNDIDFMARLHWSELNAIADLAHVVNTIIASGVNFNYIDIARVDGVVIGRLVNEMRQDASYCCFTGPALAGEQIGLGKIVPLRHGG